MESWNEPRFRRSERGPQDVAQGSMSCQWSLTCLRAWQFQMTIKMKRHQSNHHLFSWSSEKSPGLQKSVICLAPSLYH
ncbi:Uncharacterized protein HZ326_12294 [Fusarium oxysporum f. sp. albedinis]|nr:Uncharacterized protein HZ326_12294 [Fusarium oxysporum f. sp. albedinis]